MFRYFKNRWDDQNFYPEMFYPKQFVTFFPWGECCEFENSAFSEISEISHITHKRNVVEMDTGTRYRFQPREKYGKCSSFGESYRCDLTHIELPTAQTRYTHITDKQHVLPNGCYTWWGHSYMDNSIYGNKKLTTNFKSALGKFKYGQTSDLDSDVFLRVGGTLRYKKEICYVIIVHTEAQTTDEIKRLPPLRDSDHFRLNGFLYEDGRVDWKSGTLEFISRSYVNGCFDHFALAFYFNDCNNSLYLDKQKVDISQVWHNKCLRKIKVKSEFRPDPFKFWYCPDDERLPSGIRQEDLVDKY